MTTIYLAGPYSSRDLLCDYRAELTRIGYRVQSRWLDGGHDVATNPEVEAEADPEERARWAHENLDDIRRCDILVAFTAAATSMPFGGMSGGRHVETGYAVGQHKRVVLVGNPENVFHWLPGVTRVPDWHEALIELSARLVSDLRENPTAEEASA